ncbi:MAG: cytochrome c peroxidase [Acidobacteriota bacterium]|nr:cytochrome-c peroxidase [Blastocatellia bacterium]MDW8413077.1 cytochrome c peroxidase [Acidobacteriota bacterium]
MQKIVKVLFILLVAAVLVVDVAPQRAASSSMNFQVPRGLPQDLWESLIPADNPLTPEKIALGEKLFFDKRLSADRTVSCATCHDPALGFADSNAVAVGVELKKGARNSPSIINAVFNELQFWDGRAPSLEEQAKLPLINPIEMGMKDHDAVVERVKEIPEYRVEFEKVFGSEGITIDTIVKAIAAFERVQLSGDAPFDRFIAGDASAISESAKRGWELFNGKARCISCHAFNSTNPFFSDFKFHNIGVAAKDRNFSQLARKAQQLIAANKDRQRIQDELALSPGFSELGRYLVTGEPRDIGAFKTSMLRDVELTAPYMHDGSEKTLLDVIKFYDRGGEVNPNLDGGMRPLKLTDQEMFDLVEFLKTLTSDASKKRFYSLKPQTREPAK